MANRQSAAVPALLLCRGQFTTRGESSYNSRMELFDTHCHLDVEAFAPDRDKVLKRSRATGVRRMLVPAIEASAWPALVDLCRKEDGLYFALGLHPVFVDRHKDADLDSLQSTVDRERPVAIGEIGLDYFIKSLDQQRQQQLLEAQLAIARNADLPVILHVRKAHDRMLQTLRRQKLCGGIVHAFNGSEQQAQQYMDMGFCLGFGGMLTYARSHKIRHLAATLAREWLVLETDAPDMAVASHQGERNSPEYLPECVQALAEVRGEPVAEVARYTTENAIRVLGLNQGAPA